MRMLPPRPALDNDILIKLEKETEEITKSNDPKSEAKRRFVKVRNAKWFQPVISTLRRMAGKGECCMYCSRSEASDVEHYRPKTKYPQNTMDWSNYLWTCTFCNRNKLNNFPVDTHQMALLIDPSSEDPWAFFFIDEFGLLTARYDHAKDAPDIRAETTLDIIKLNRQALQESRKERLDDLKNHVLDWLRHIQTGNKTKKQIQEEIDIHQEQPFQKDVADYFLRGPGMKEPPFSDLFDYLTPNLPASINSIK